MTHICVYAYAYVSIMYTHTHRCFIKYCGKPSTSKVFLIHQASHDLTYPLPLPSLTNCIPYPFIMLDHNRPKCL